MKKSSILFLQGVIVLFGLGVFTLLLWEPHLEGINANATTLYQIYFDDPFLALVYLGAVPFFVALYHAVRVLGYVRHDKTFSPIVVKSLRTIKYCAFIVIGFVAIEEIFIILTHGDDDAAGGIMMGVFIAFGALVSAVAASIFERVLQKAVELQAESELTV